MKSIGQTVFKRKYLGYFLIGLGGIVGALIVLMFFISREQGLILPLLLISAIGCVVVGSILSFTQYLDHIIQPIVEEIDEDIKDDIADIKARRITNAQVMFVLTGILALVFLYFFLKLHKIEAAWGGIPVYIPAFILAGIGTMIVVNTRWFHNQQLRTPLRIFLIPLLGILISMWLGIQTENPRNLSFDVQNQVVYNEFTPLAFDFIRVPFSVGGSVGSLDCDGDACLIAVLVIALIVITLLMVIGSAFIPHFWLLSCLVLLTILMIITIHEIRLRPKAAAVERISHSIE